jgi:hypothetical protein
MVEPGLFFSPLRGLVPPTNVHHTNDLATEGGEGGLESILLHSGRRRGENSSTAEEELSITS